LVELYRELTAAIRAVDQSHMIIYEGTHWATNWSMFTEVWDANSMLSFHKYWSPPDRPSIQRFIDIAGSLGLPIYMGDVREGRTTSIGSRQRSSYMRTATSRGASGPGRRSRLSPHLAR